MLAEMIKEYLYFWLKYNNLSPRINFSFYLSSYKDFHFSINTVPISQLPLLSFLKISPRIIFESFDRSISSPLSLIKILYGTNYRTTNRRCIVHISVFERFKANGKASLQRAHPLLFLRSDPIGAMLRAKSNL